MPSVRRAAGILLTALAWPSCAATPPRPAGELTIETISYASSADDTPGLLADVAFPADGAKKPLLVVMHGFSGSKADVRPDLVQLARHGLVAVAPDLRGHGASQGVEDCGGKDVHDILDAVLAALARYPAEIDASNLNIVGYSGGGGNAIACAVRFPDLFRTCVSFFGISDYAAWHASRARPDCNKRMERALGGTPAANPGPWAARDANAAAGNARAKLHLFWDEQESQCPPGMIEAFLRARGEAGLAAATVHVSRVGDRLRWRHGYRTGNPDLAAADALFLPDVLARDPQAPRLPEQGRLVVNGYLVTRAFTVWLAAPGVDTLAAARRGPVLGRATIEYDLRGPEPKVRVVDNPRTWAVLVRPVAATDQDRA